MRICKISAFIIMDREAAGPLFNSYIQFFFLWFCSSVTSNQSDVTLFSRAVTSRVDVKRSIEANGNSQATLN